MGIKQQEYALSRADFDEALVRLRLNVSEVSRETGISRPYLSEFRNGDRQLRPEQLAKLKDYFESKGLKFEEQPQTHSTPAQTQLIPIDVSGDPEGLQRAMLSVRHLAIDPSLSTDQVKAMLEKIAANDSQAEKIFQLKAEEGLFSGWNAATDYALRDIFGLFAANYALLRHLQGRSLVVMPDPNGEIKSISDLFAHLFHQENGEVVGSQSAEELLVDEEEDTE